MGLDMYAYITTDRPQEPVDVEIDDRCREIFYWRKHPDLHGWMEALYRAKGGASRYGFNCESVELTLADLDALEETVRKRELPQTEGFFFGASDGEEYEGDLEFIELARDAIKDGYHVLYSSWW